MLFNKKIKASQIIWEQRKKIQNDLKIHRKKLYNIDIEEYPEYLTKEMSLVTEEQGLWKLYYKLKEQNL